MSQYPSFDFSNGIYGDIGPHSGNITFNESGFEIQVGGSNANHYTRINEEIFSVKIFDSDIEKPQIDMYLVLNNRQIINVRFTLKKDDATALSDYLKRKGFLKQIGLGNPCKIFAKQTKRYSTINPSSKQNNMGFMERAYYNHSLDLLYSQLSGRNTTSVSLHVLETELRKIENVSSETSQILRGPIDVSSVALNNESTFEEYIRDIKDHSNCADGRALIECLFINTLFTKKQNEGEGIKTLGELRNYVDYLKKEYRKMVDNWVSVDQKLLTDEFNNDINVIAKDVVRTEKGCKDVKPDFEIFEMEKKIAMKKSEEEEKRKSIENGTGNENEDDKLKNKEGEEDNDSSNTSLQSNFKNNMSQETERRNEEESESEGIEKEKESEKLINQLREYISNKNIQDKDRLGKILKSSITTKFLLPFLAKEAAEKGYLTTNNKSDEYSPLSRQATTEKLISSLTEFDYEHLIYTYSAQIRMFNVLVTCFMNDPPISYVQGMNDFVGSLCEQTIICAREGKLFGMDADIETVEALMYFMFCYILNIHKRAFSTQPLNGSMSVLHRFGQAICEINPSLYCAMQRVDYDSILLHLLNPYLLFFRREIESGAASIRLMCEALTSTLGYNYIFVLMLAYVDITVVPALEKCLKSKGEKPEPLLPLLSHSAKTDSVKLLELSRIYMNKKRIANVLVHFFGRHYHI